MSPDRRRLRASRSHLSSEAIVDLLEDRLSASRRSAAEEPLGLPCTACREKLRARGALPRGAVAAVVLGAFIRTAGEVVGYVVGARPDAQPRMDHYELHKLAFTEMEDNA